MARYIVPAEMPKSCAHCHFSVLKYQHPFFSKEKPNTKGYFCPFEGLTLELDFYDYTTKADWCPLVAIEDTADVVPKSEVVKALNEVELLIIITKEMYKQQMEDAPNELSKQSKRTKWVAFEKFYEQFAELKKKYTEGNDG